MNSQLALNLAMLLFLPWYAILGVLFWLYPKQPRHAARRWFDATSLAVAVAAAFAGTHWGFLHASPSPGVLWKQLLATSVSYGLFLGVLALAIGVRRRLWARAEPGSDPNSKRATGA